ncbi:MULTISPECIES: ABC transporter ATP-binding protein [Enterococcus]|uniref:ABC transporter ATP-binding protein n=1 Tax=Enterococcus TaxID=1350 RepID=UPI003562CB4B
MEIIQTIGVEKTYGQGDAKVLALRGIDLTINRGEFLAIVGTSGSGKSTLLYILGGLDQPTKGEVKVHGKNIEKLNDEALTIFRRRNIGFVFQKYNLVPMLTVWENIVVPILLDGKKIDKEYISELITLLRLTDKVNSHPNELSGGQQQRVAIARALATKPVIIFADEPTGNLDSKTGQDVLGLLRITSKKFKQTMVIITHDEEVAQLADRIIRMEDVEDGILVSEVRDG